MNLAITSGATITAGGLVRMTGGSLAAGGINNFGELSLETHSSIVSAASIFNSGLITGNGRISGILNNSAAGEIRASAGERIAFTNGGGFSSNAGNINLFGGTVEFDQLTNNGRITGRGVFLTDGGLSNNGTATFSGGTSDILGNVVNNAAARVIVTGGSTSTFFDGVTNNAGSEFRVSTGATAVFLGAVSGLSQFTGGGTKIFEGPSSFGALATAGSSVVESSGTLTAQHVRETSLTIYGGVSIEPNGTFAGTSTVETLDIDGGATPTGTLELGDNAFVVDHSGGSPIATLAQQIAFAYNGGAWDRPGITSRLATASTFAVGIAERSSLSIVPPIFGTVDADAVLIRFTRYGDADLNGVVNSDDFNMLATNFGTAGNLWSEGNFNYDALGTVNSDDFNLLATNFGLSATGPEGTVTPQDWANLAAAVPEPSMSVLLFTLLTLCSPRACSRRRSGTTSRASSQAKPRSIPALH